MRRNRAYRAAARIPATTKYRAKKVKCDGYTFDSQAEYYRYLQLRDMVEKKQAFHLEVHPRFKIICEFRDWQGGHHSPTYYESDFMYDDPSGKVWVEDVKGVSTEVYKLKKKLFLSFYQRFCFREIPAKSFYGKRR